jgi:hypothetical protein
VGQPPSAVLRAQLDCLFRHDPQNHTTPPCRRSKIRLMRASPWKDAARWHKSGVKSIADPSLPSRQRAKERSLSAIACMRHGQPLLTASQRAHLSLQTFNSPTTADGTGIALYVLSHVRTCVRPPAAPRRFLLRIPNGLTESVPIGILLLQTAVVSIH